MLATLQNSDLLGRIQKRMEPVFNPGKHRLRLRPEEDQHQLPKTNGIQFRLAETDQEWSLKGIDATRGPQGKSNKEYSGQGNVT